jgi:DNA-binding IclR family transcriptional regulator
MNRVLDIEQNHERRRGLVPAVQSACRILDLLARGDRDGRTLSEVARELELSKSSVHGLLATLTAYGYVQRSPDSRRYRLGAALVPLGRAAAGQLQAAALVSERLAALAGEHRLTFAVAQVTEYGDAQVIDRAYPLSDIHVGVTLGSRYGPFDGAIGKCLLAAMSEEAAERLVGDADIPRHTGRTIAEAGALLADVQGVRARGWAASIGELKANHAVAAPLHGPGGELELVLFAVGFPGQLEDDAIAAVGGVLRETARAIRVELGATVNEEGRA